jgi:hypothetical protein
VREIELRDCVVAEDDAGRRAQLRAAIVRHLQRYPLAGDTAEGFIACWLPRKGFGDAGRYIADVIEAMVVAGELEPRRLPDGRILYVRGRALGG